ncbi:GyrI-like domain-containing protein [Terrabacter aerolatus]|uniref:Transcription activator effector-binding protein n=1 Tax=Terrabacter aerolatus TaxID=422442 RepID=A0A512D4I5_9MICO|nr:GyrI-like domain-containing protein [Terrabacter aerolatus]GEO31384.1 transcription activator effector-binding protein [Terrabacter aerolatus]
MNEIRTVETTEQPTAVVRSTVAMDELPAFFARAFATAAATIGQQGQAPAGPPFGLYRGMPTTVVDVEAGFPVARPVEAAGEVVPSTLPGGSVVEAVHVGPYDTMGETYGQVERWMVDRQLVPGPVVWESYLSDPEREPDPTTWRTLVHWSLA